jgi:23S rRNA (cytidine1920-2'-O)/16S rRNA (cytidine1409-2'-O)-methyltransferase
MSNRERLDDVLVRRGVYATRARAREAILRGAVTVAGEAATRPGRRIAPDAALAIADHAKDYVSRAALKLQHGLAHFGIAPEGRFALDIGASTGGFTQVLLEQGAAHVTAIDVGHGQLADAIRNDARVSAIEGLNARDLTPAHLPHPVDLVVCDVSFISLKIALPPALALAGRRADLIALLKPQFEAGRAAVGKTGVVADRAVHARVCKDIANFLAASGWTVIGLTPSPIPGGDGNREFLIAARKGDLPSPARGEGRCSMHRRAIPPARGA